MNEPTIAAEVHSDDRVYRTSFDAAGWFKAASAEDIAALAREDWSCCSEADEEARTAEAADPAVHGLLDYARRKDGTGFECSVEATQAMSWLKENRADVFAEVCAKAHLDPEDYGDVNAAPRM